MVTVWERLVKEYQTSGELLVDLGSDQTSCHDPFGGGYYPVQISFEEAKQVKSQMAYASCSCTYTIGTINQLYKKKSV